MLSLVRGVRSGGSAEWQVVLRPSGVHCEDVTTSIVHDGQASPGVSRSTRAWAIVRLTRPWFWPLGWAGAYLGAVLATGSWLPPVHDGFDSIAVLVVLGPLVWGAVLAMNDLYDLPSDRRNPRKANAPLVTGVLSAADLKRWGWLCGIVTMVLALAVGPLFATGTAVVLILSWLYSVPPFRLKARPGADLAVNAVVVGVLAPVSGWSLHRPPLDYPLIMVVLGLLVAAALYLPTTVMDEEADRGAGDSTAAVRWTPLACRRLGCALWLSAIVVWVACCHLGLLVRRDDWLFQDLMAPVLMAVYAVLTAKPTIARMAVISVTFAVPALDFLAAYVSSGVP